MKAKRILALSAVAVLILLYLLCFIFALIDSPLTAMLFRGCLVLTIIIPILLYVFLMLLRQSKKDKEQ